MHNQPELSMIGPRIAWHVPAGIDLFSLVLPALLDGRAAIERAYRLGSAHCFGRGCCRERRGEMMDQLPAPVPNVISTGQGHQGFSRQPIAASPQWEPIVIAADGQTAQAAVIAALQTRRDPLRTRDVRERINRNRQEPLVNERVYQALVTLHQRGLVMRLKSLDHRDVYWQLPKTSGPRRKPANNEPRRF
jgi:hypothetical protein